jgi:hypothetical protein
MDAPCLAIAISFLSVPPHLVIVHEEGTLAAFESVAILMEHGIRAAWRPLGRVIAMAKEAVRATG